VKVAVKAEKVQLVEGKMQQSRRRDALHQAEWSVARGHKFHPEATEKTIFNGEVAGFNSDVNESFDVEFVTVVRLNLIGLEWQWCNPASLSPDVNKFSLLEKVPSSHNPVLSHIQASKNCSYFALIVLDSEII
jgi:hypothetical protein